MKQSLLAQTLTARVQAHIEEGVVKPTYIEGSPGIGKTAIPKQVARNLHTNERPFGFICLHGPLMQAEDFGMPLMNGDDLKFAVPKEKFPFEGTDVPDHGMLVFDEAAQMDVPQQKIMANLVQERELHGFRLKPGWHVAATGNRQQDRAGANRILSQLNDRMTRYELEVSHGDWVHWALTNGVRAEVIAFINFKADVLNRFDPNALKSPTPRAWAEGVSRSLDVVPKEAELETFQGDVGEGAAAEFVAFLQTWRELPDPDVVLSNPDTHPMPDNLSVLYALTGALAARANEDNIDKVIRFTKRLSRVDRPEFGVLLIRSAITRDGSLKRTRAYMDWALNEGAQILM